MSRIKPFTRGAVHTQLPVSLMNDK